jgi:hypothetical protein
MTEVLKIVSSYTEAQKRATEKYRHNNKDKVNEQRKKYYQTRKEKDPQFLEYKRMKSREYYLKKKLTKPEDKPDEKMEDVKPEPNPVDVKTETPDVVMTPIDSSTKEPKKKKEKKVKDVMPKPLLLSPEEIKFDVVDTNELLKILVPTSITVQQVVEPSIEPLKKSRKQKKA